DSSRFNPAQLSAMDKRKRERPNLRLPDEVKDNLDREHSVKEAESYNIYCAVCHQRNGLGNDRFPPLSGSEWVSGDKNVLINVVLNGLEGNIMVKGKSYNNRMPKMALLSDEDIARILTYIRQQFNNADSVTVEEVSKARKLLAGDSQVSGNQ
ncbi:MAG TPA: cytochrome c, partial [Agriterribacter sp.]|nr:cytochrome c [Agriterribacter sp.]